MKADWVTKLLLLLIALGLWVNVLSHPRDAQASAPSDCSDAESVARKAYEEIHKLRCGTTDFYGNVTVTEIGNSVCLTLPDLLSRVKR